MERIEGKKDREKALYRGKIFVCRYCGNPVFTTDERDRRSVFCSKECERKYWKKTPGARRSREKRAGRIFDEIKASVEKILAERNED